MGHAAVLSVLVKVDGIARTVAQVRALDNDLGRAGSASDRMGGFARAAGEKVRQMGGDVDRARRHVKGIGDDSSRTSGGLRALASGFGGASGGAGALAGSLGPLRGGLGHLAIVAAALGPVLLALGGAAFALVAALAPLVGLGPAAAVGLTAFAQAAGVVALASMGVGDALKEQLDATGKTAKAATTGADQQRSAARAIQSAQEGVRNAHEQVRTATLALADAERNRTAALNALAPAQQQARRALQDMRAALTGAFLAERQAVIGLKDARDQLADALRPADVARLADAQSSLTTSTLSEQRAVLGLTDARQRLADLMKPADALTVADAQDAVADATRGETRAALALATAREAAAKILNDPAASEADRARAKLDLADAENAVGDATRASAHAQAQLAKVQAGPDPADIARAKLDVAAAEQSVADASRDTAKAQQAITDAMKGADPAAVAKAQLAVAFAEHDLADAIRSRARLQKDVAAAEKAGIGGSAGVISARERIAEATRQVSAAERGLEDAHRQVAKAEQAVRDAQTDAAAGMAATAAAAVDLNEKFNGLSPAAQAFVRVLQGLKPKLDELRATAASGLFPGVIAGIRVAMSNFDPLKRVVGETATVIGGLAKRAGELVGSKGFGADLETIGGRNALIIDRVGRAMIYAADGARHLLVAAGPLTTWLAKVTLEWTKSVTAAIESGRESGKLADFFQTTRNTLIRVVSIVANLGEAFFNVGKAAAPFGRDMLASIDRVAGRFNEWTKSVAGQRALQDFFAQSTDLAGKLMPALGGVLGSLGEMAFMVLPAYIAVLDALGPLAGPLIQAFILWKVAMTGVAIATGLATAAQTVYTAVTKGGIVYTIAAKAAAIASAAATKAWAAGQWLLNAALTANPIGLVVIAIAALVAGVILAYKHSETFRDIVNGVWNAIKTVAGPIIEWLGGAVVDTWEAIKTATATVWPVIKDLIITPAGEAFEWLKGAVADVIDWLGVDWETIKLAAKIAWVLFKWFIVTPVKEAFEWLKGAVGDIIDWLEPKWEAIKTAAKTAWGLVKDYIVQPVKDAIDAIKDAIGQEGLIGWLSARWEDIKGFASTGWNLIKDAITGPVGDAIDAVKKAIGHGGKDPAGLIGWLTTAWDDVKGVFDKAKDALSAAIAAPFKAGLDLVSGFAKKILQVVDEIPGVDMSKPIGEIDEFRKAQGFAHGGAYARTGGLVTSPITLMGEEAPRHREWVIPENPAYRPRAQKLAMMAAKAVGLAEGGAWSQKEIKALAERHGMPNPGLMSAVAMAESGGRPWIVGPPSGRGLWQIEWDVWADTMRRAGLSNAFDPDQNAEMAEIVLAQQGINAWVAYTNGSYKQFMDGGGGIVGAIKGIAGKVADLIADGGSALLGMLPDASGLGWLKGLGEHVLGKVGDWIKSKVSGLFGGGGDLPAGVSGSVQKAIELAMSMGFGHPSPNQLTGGEHAAGSLHYAGRAVDFGDAGRTVEQMQGLFMALVEQFGSSLNELFYDRMPWHINSHRKVMGQFGHHGDHIHAAFRQGGAWGSLLGSYEQGTPYVPQTGPYLLHRGESVTPADQNADRGPLVHVEHMHVREEADLTMFAREFGWALR